MKEKKIRLEITLKEYAELSLEAPEGSVLKKIIKRYEDNMIKRDYWKDMHYAPTEQERAEAKELYLAKIKREQN